MCKHLSRIYAIGYCGACYPKASYARNRTHIREYQTKYYGYKNHNPIRAVALKINEGKNEI